MATIERVEYGRCGQCGHEIALARFASIHGWAHHITRSKMYGAPHGPAGHILTAWCERAPCQCGSSAPNLGFPVKARLVYLGTNTDPLP
jgi:hypothetical protein